MADARRYNVWTGGKDEISFDSLLMLVGFLIGWKSFEGSKKSLQEKVTNLFRFGMASGLVAGVWYITYHHPKGMHRQTWDYFTDVFFPTCGELLHSDLEMFLYEITCH